MVQLTLGTKRTALALYGVLLVLPTIVLGGLHWRQLVMDHEAMLASVPGDARDVTNQIRIAIRDSLRAVVDREELRGFYEYKPNYFPPGTLGTDLAFVPSPLRVGPTRPEILGWFSYSHDDIGRGRPPIGLIGSRESEPDAQDRLDQTLIWTLDLQRRDRARRERVKSIEESIEDVVNIFTLPAKERELLALVPSRVDKLRLPILAINLSEEESIDCIREELPALRVYELEEQQVSISQFRLRFYRDDLGSPRVVAMRSVSIPGNEHLANFKGCFESLGKRTIIEQGFFIDAEWLFHELPASTAAKFIQKGSPHRFIPMEEAKLPNRAGVEDYEVLPIQWLDLEMMDESDIEYGMFKVAVNVDDLERRFHTVGVRFLGVAAMLIVSLATGLVLLLRSVNRDLETARRTENFIAAVTHELRTPVAAIKLYGEMLQDGWVDDDPGKLKEYYRRIVRETGRLETLVENVLEKSQIARREADSEPGDLNAVVESLESSLKSLGPDGVKDLEFEYGEDLPQVMLIPEGVRSIVSNLVENARKYAPVKPGVAGAEPIVVRTHVLADMAVLDVMDRGPGIPHAERTKIFQAFYRVGNEHTRTARGTGLGLHLVLLQSNAMGARISVLDRKGGGTVFRVTFQPGAPA